MQGGPNFIRIVANFRPIPPQSVVIIIIGDVMLITANCLDAATKGYPWGWLKEYPRAPQADP